MRGRRAAAAPLDSADTAGDAAALARCDRPEGAARRRWPPPALVRR
ncbi:hypothetical protein [Sorangium cellulosum]|nr:hypothetical protein [Sorangium cellulosum]